MLRELEKAERKWGGSNKLIDQWLDNRRKLLVHYCQVAGVPPYGSTGKVLPSFDHLKSFCDSLVDYVSEGHFEVYDQVVSACEKCGIAAKNLAERILPKIAPTTEAALNFSDKYAETLDDDVLYQLDEDLSTLAQSMERRFELEDRLLEVLYDKHSTSHQQSALMNNVPH